MVNNINNFKLCDWKENFFPYIYNFTKEKTNYRLHDALLVFPTSRSCTICIEYIQTIENNILLPQIMTLNDFIEYCEILLLDEEIIESNDLDLLDNIYILYQIVKKLAKAKEGNFFKSLLANPKEGKQTFFHNELKSFSYFFQYGQHLYELLQECLDAFILPTSISYATENIDEFSQFLLRNISHIAEEYIKYLEENSCSTKAYKKYSLAEKIKNCSSKGLNIFNDKTIIFCGLDNLKKSEEILLKAFEREGIYFLFLSDPKLAIDFEHAHWSTGFYKELAKKWNKKYELLPIEYSENYLFDASNKNNFLESDTKFFFHQAFDVHSQFQNLNIDQSKKRRACIINSESSLLPLIYTLNNNYNDKDLNIAIGFPLKESKLFQCIFILDKIKKSSRNTLGKNQKYLFNYNDIRSFVSFDFLDIDNENIIALMKESGHPYVDFEEIIFEEDEKNYFQKILFDWMEIEKLEDLIHYIENFYSLHFHLLSDNDFERLALIHLKSCVFLWKDKIYLKEDFSYDLCVRILYNQMENMLVPFENHSDEALQVLTLNQTKNLQYDVLHVFDVNDEFLPGKRKENPIVPESLYAVIGLNHRQEHEQRIAHNWYKLIAGAKEVHLYWQESTTKSLFDTKKTRSPYLEDALWRVEERINTLLDVEDEKNNKNQIFTQALCPLSLSSEKKIIFVDEVIRKKLVEFSLTELSSSSLDIFLECPLKFFYKYICKFKEIDKIEEGDNYAKLGTVVHDFIKSLYNENETVKKQTLYARFEHNLKKLDFFLNKEDAFKVFSSESIFLLKKSIPYRIKKYLFNQPDEVHIHLLERELKAKIDNSLQIKGVIDRVDTVEEGNGLKQSLVIDYKSGSIKKIPSSDFWSEHIDIFEIFLEKPELIDQENSLLSLLYKDLPSLQLPIYYYLAHLNGLSPANAAYIDLADTCLEYKLLEDCLLVDMPHKVYILLKFMQKYMQNIQVLSSHARTDCSYCSFKRFCS